MDTPDLAAQRAVAAIDAWDEDAYYAAGRALIEACETASAGEIEPALARLAPVLARVEIGRAWGLAETAGVMAFGLADVTPFLGMFVARACEAMEQAAQFRALHTELLGHPPPPADRSVRGAVVTRFGAAARSRTPNPTALVDSWFYGDPWVRPVLMLAQRAGVRAAMPERERLLRAVEGIGDDFDNATFLYGLLLVLDDVPILVLDRSSGRGFRVTIGGIGDNDQLHTLLAARLIGDPSAGWLSGTPPTADMIASAGTGDLQPAGGIVAQFNLVDVYGRPLDTRPAYIPVLDGERVIVLDPPGPPRRWASGRVYPLMVPTAQVDRQLPAGEAAAWLGRARPALVRTGPSDDLRVPGHEPAELVDIVLHETLIGTAAPTIQRLLITRLGVSQVDARLAWDRTLGGLLRSGTHPSNQPDSDNDPVAFEAYQRGIADSTLRTRVFKGPTLHGPVEPVRIRSSRWKMFAAFLASVGLVAGGVWSIGAGDVRHIILGAVAIAFFGIGVVMFGARLVTNPVILQIDEDGYVDRSSLATPGRILWTEVAGVAIRELRLVRRVASTRYLEITVADPEAVLRRASPLRRIVMRANRAAGYGTVTIGESLLPYSLETLIEIMRRQNPGLAVLPTGR